MKRTPGFVTRARAHGRALRRALCIRTISEQICFPAGNERVRESANRDEDKKKY